MKVRPILFTIEMVTEILAGNKTQTRRVIKPQPDKAAIISRVEFSPKENCWCWLGPTIEDEFLSLPFMNNCPYGKPGDRLWVREMWRCEELESGLDGIRYAAGSHFEPIQNTHEAAEAWMAANRKNNKWRPSIFMPRWASRILLEIVDVRVEGIQQISEKDAQAEGIKLYSEDIDLVTGFADKYRFLWDYLNSKRGFGWMVNPWVWVIEFKRVEEK